MVIDYEGIGGWRMMCDVWVDLGNLYVFICYFFFIFIMLFILVIGC